MAKTSTNNPELEATKKFIAFLKDENWEQARRQLEKIVDTPLTQEERGGLITRSLTGYFEASASAYARFNEQARNLLERIKELTRIAKEVEDERRLLELEEEIDSMKSSS